MRHQIGTIHHDLPIERPSLALLGIEPWRAALEFASHHLLPADAEPARGDGHPVVIFPGMGSDGRAVAPMRRYCSSPGCEALDWWRGFNRGPDLQPIGRGGKTGPVRGRSVTIPPGDRNCMDAHRVHGWRDNAEPCGCPERRLRLPDDGACHQGRVQPSAPVQHLLLRYTQALMTQMAQTAVCNRHHTVDQQLCRWLLLSLDVLEGNELTMTHDLIANMLGVRRERVTEAALKLQRAGLISHARGHVKVLDRRGLEQRACECHAVVRAEYVRLLPKRQAT